MTMNHHRIRSSSSYGRDIFKMITQIRLTSKRQEIRKKNFDRDSLDGIDGISFEQIPRGIFI